MANAQTENLYLLEFLVNDVNLKTQRCDCMSGGGELCVAFQFLDNQELKLCERDVSEDQSFSDDNTRIGKSCIFSLTPKQAETALRQFDLNVSLYRKSQPETCTDTLLGVAVVPITELLVELVESCDCAPVAKVLEDKFPLTNQGQNIGSIDVYIRLSCYGKMIITQFQMNMEDKTVLFKDKEGRSLYRYRRRKSAKPTKIEDVSGKDQKNPNCPSQPCFPDGVPPDFAGMPPCSMDGPQCPPFDMGCPPMGGPPMGGSPMGGFPIGGPPMGGFSMGGPPMGGFSMGGPPMGAFSMGGPPMGAFPMSGPPSWGGMMGPDLGFGGGFPSGAAFGGNGGGPPCFGGANPACPSQPCFGGGFANGGLPMDASPIGATQMAGSSPKDTGIFYSPLLAQQAAVFPNATYDQQVTKFGIGIGGASGRGGGGCGGGCGRK